MAGDAVDGVIYKTDCLEITITRNGGYTKNGSHFDVPLAELSDAGRVLEIPLKYDLTGRFDLRVFRSHADEYGIMTSEPLDQLSSWPATPAERRDGTFFVDGQGANAVVYVYSQFFSTFTMHSSDRPVYTVRFESNGGSTVSPVRVGKGDKLTRPADPARAATADVQYAFDK